MLLNDRCKFVVLKQSIKAMHFLSLKIIYIYLDDASLYSA